MPAQARLVTSSEIARELGVSRQTVARWVRDGWVEPSVITAGGQARFRLEDVKRQLRDRQKKGD